MTVICAKKLGCKKICKTRKKSPSWPHLSFRTERELSQPPNLTFSWLTFGVKAIKPIVQKYRVTQLLKTISKRSHRTSDFFHTLVFARKSQSFLICKNSCELSVSFLCDHSKPKGHFI